MLFEDDNSRLQRGIASLSNLEEKVRKYKRQLIVLDCKMDETTFDELEGFPEEKMQARERRRRLSHVNGVVTDKLEKVEKTLKDFRELLGVLGTKLNYAELFGDVAN